MNSFHSSRENLRTLAYFQGIQYMNIFHISKSLTVRLQQLPTKLPDLQKHPAALHHTDCAHHPWRAHGHAPVQAHPRHGCRHPPVLRQLTSRMQAVQKTNLWSRVPGARPAHTALGELAGSRVWDQPVSGLRCSAGEGGNSLGLKCGWD